MAGLTIIAYSRTDIPKASKCRKTKRPLDNQPFDLIVHSLSETVHGYKLNLFLGLGIPHLHTSSYLE